MARFRGAGGKFTKPGAADFGSAVYEITADDSGLFEAIQRDADLIRSTVASNQRQFNRMSGSIDGVGASAFRAEPGITALATAASLSGNSAVGAAAQFLSLGKSVGLLFAAFGPAGWLLTGATALAAAMFAYASGTKEATDRTGELKRAEEENQRVRDKSLTTLRAFNKSRQEAMNALRRAAGVSEESIIKLDFSLSAQEKKNKMELLEITQRTNTLLERNNEIKEAANEKERKHAQFVNDVADREMARSRIIKEQAEALAARRSQEAASLAMAQSGFTAFVEFARFQGDAIRDQTAALRELETVRRAIKADPTQAGPGLDFLRQRGRLEAFQQTSEQRGTARRFDPGRISFGGAEKIKKQQVEDKGVVAVLDRIDRAIQRFKVHN